MNFFSVSVDLSMCPVKVVENKWELVAAVFHQIRMKSLGSLSSLLPYLTPGRGPFHARFPVAMERMEHYEGLVLYRTTIPKHFPPNSTLDLTGCCSNKMYF